MRILITFASHVLTKEVLSASLILALALVLVGCAEKQEKTNAEGLIEARQIVYQKSGSPKIDSVDTLPDYLLYYYTPNPCPPETVYAMPPGEWVEVGWMGWDENGRVVASNCTFGDSLGDVDCPDSAFIPRKESP